MSKTRGYKNIVFSCEIILLHLECGFTMSSKNNFDVEEWRLDERVARKKSLPSEHLKTVSAAGDQLGGVDTRRWTWRFSRSVSSVRCQTCKTRWKIFARNKMTNLSQNWSFQDEVSERKTRTFFPVLSFVPIANPFNWRRQNYGSQSLESTCTCESACQEWWLFTVVLVQPAPHLILTSAGVTGPFLITTWIDI